MKIGGTWGELIWMTIVAIMALGVVASVIINLIIYPTSSDLSVLSLFHNHLTGGCL